MSASQIALALAIAVLLFWIVGAYNRVVRLRSDIVARFVPLDQRLREREQLLTRLVETLATALPGAAARLDALAAATRQADTAREHARTRPGAAGAVTSLRVAEKILAEARSQLPVAAAAGGTLPELAAAIETVELALGFARDEFNAAVIGYNRAVGQFPTIIIARLFGFRSAATL